MNKFETQISDERGFITISIENGNIGTIEILAVFPDYRGNGVGKFFMNKALEFFKNYGNIEKVKLTASSFYNDEYETNALEQDKLVEFYKTFGFVEVPTTESFIVPMELKY